MTFTDRRSMVFILSLLLLCCFKVEASSLTKKAHSHRTRAVVVDGDEQDGVINKRKQDQGAPAPAPAGDSDDDDDDDDDDDEDNTPAKMTYKIPRAVALKAMTPQEKEEAKLQGAVDKADEELEANLAKQKELQEKIKHLSDESASDREIDASAKLVANETDSIAMANMLGNMWKEMRMFDLPFFAQHVQEEIHLLKREENELESELTAAQAKLSAFKEEQDKKAAEAAQKKKAAAEEEDGEDEKDEKDDKKKDEEGKEDKDDNDEKSVAKGKQNKKVASGVQSVEGQVEQDILEGENVAMLSKWSFWHMNRKQKTNALMSSLVYLLFGILVAYVYAHIKKNHASLLEPAPVKPNLGGRKDFTSSLFGCFGDLKICAIGCCCPVVRWADTMDRQPGTSGRPLLDYWKAFFLMFILMLLHSYTVGLSAIAVILVGVSYRQKLRRKYNIEAGKSTIFMDLVVWGCCQPCAIIQEAREQGVKADQDIENNSQIRS